MLPAADWKYSDIKELNTHILIELIEKMVIYEKQTTQTAEKDRG